MHGAVRDWVRQSLPLQYETVLEIGSRDMNGGVRDLLSGDIIYTGVDLYEGPNVDVACDFVGYTHPEELDLILCLGTFEHCETWPEIVKAVPRSLKDGGMFLFTCASHGFQPHSGLSIGGGLKPGEFYKNVGPDEMHEVIKECFNESDVKQVGVDLLGWAIK